MNAFNPNVIVPILIGLAILAVVGWNFYKKKNPTAAAALEDKFKTDVTTALASLHTKLDAVHQAALAPVSVTLVPAVPAAAPPPPAAAPAPVAAAAAAAAAPVISSAVTVKPDASGLMPWQQPAIVYDASTDGAFGDFRAAHGPLRKYVASDGNEIDVRGNEIKPADTAAPAFDPNAWAQANGVHYDPVLAPGQSATISFTLNAGKFMLGKANVGGAMSEQLKVGDATYGAGVMIDVASPTPASLTVTALGDAGASASYNLFKAA